MDTAYARSSRRRCSRLRARFSSLERPTSDSPRSACLRFARDDAGSTRTEEAAARAGFAEPADLRVNPEISPACWAWLRLFMGLRVLTYSFSFMDANSVPVTNPKASR